MSDRINFNYKIDTTELQNLASYFSNKDWFNVKKKTLQKTGNKIKRDARALFKQRLPAATKRSQNFSDRLIDAIRSSKIKNEGLGELRLKVHTMGNRKKGSGTFRARFFESGTQDRIQRPYVDSLGRRYTHSRSIGRIKPLNYFADTLSKQTTYENTIIRDLEGEIIKLTNKKYL